MQRKVINTQEINDLKDEGVEIFNAFHAQIAVLRAMIESPSFATILQRSASQKA